MLVLSAGLPSPPVSLRRLPSVGRLVVLHRLPPTPPPARWGTSSKHPRRTPRYGGTAAPHSIADPGRFFFPCTSPSHGRTGRAPHGARAPVLPPGRRPLQGLARPHRRARQRHRGLPCAVPLTASPSASYGRRSSRSTSTTSATRWRPGTKARGSTTRPAVLGARAQRRKLPRSSPTARGRSCTPGPPRQTV